MNTKITDDNPPRIKAFKTINFSSFIWLLHIIRRMGIINFSHHFLLTTLIARFPTIASLRCLIVCQIPITAYRYCLPKIGGLGLPPSQTPASSTRMQSASIRAVSSGVTILSPAVTLLNQIAGIQQQFVCNFKNIFFKQVFSSRS